MANFTRVFQPITSWLNWPNVFNGPDLQHHQLTNTIHLTLKMTSPQVVETSVTNNSSFQNYTHPDDHTIWTTEVLLICSYFWPVNCLFFRVNLTIFDKNDTASSAFATKPRKIFKNISKLKPFTLYAFQVEAVVLENEGAKSDLVFIQTKESGMLRQGQHFCNLQKRTFQEHIRMFWVHTFFSNNGGPISNSILSSKLTPPFWHLNLLM